jgi:hypothetical protein
LIAELADADIQVTRYQLERWRQHGLLPRPMVSHYATGAQTELPSDSLSMARILAGYSTRGRDWQASVIYLYECGFVASESALRAAAAWKIRKTDQAIERITRELKRQTDTDELEAVENLMATIKRRKSARTDRRNLLEVIRSRNPYLGQQELRYRADAAEFWTHYFALFPVTRNDPDLLAIADGFTDAAEGRAYGWTPKGRANAGKRIRAVAPTITRGEMAAMALVYEEFIDVPGFEYIDRGAPRFDHALADIANVRSRHSRNLRTPVNPATIYMDFGLEEVT